MQSAAAKRLVVDEHLQNVIPYMTAVDFYLPLMPGCDDVVNQRSEVDEPRRETTITSWGADGAIRSVECGRKGDDQNR